MGLFLKNHETVGLALFAGQKKSCPIGVDVKDDTVQLAQLASNGDGVSLIAGGVRQRPAELQPGSGSWQRWVIDAIRQITAIAKFRGKHVIAAIPTTELFIDHLRIPNNAAQLDEKTQQIINSRIKTRLPFNIDNAMIKYVPTEEGNVIVMAADRTIIDRHLAIYEQVNLAIKSICVWPSALVNTYTSFFARRQADHDAVVMLIQTDSGATNVAICRHQLLLFAHSIPIGTQSLDGDDVATRLVVELAACRRQFASIYKKPQIQRVIFLTSQEADKPVCIAIAKQLEMPAQIGDCLAAVKVENPQTCGIDRRDSKVNWAGAFGLSLS